MSARKHVLQVGILFVIALFGMTAGASLGENDNSVEADRQAFSGTVKVSTQKNFTVYQITTAGGVAVKEYVSNQGTVFGITWRGLTHPDFQQLFGVYHGEYLEQQTSKPKGFYRGHEKLTGANIVVEKEGHMRDVRGRAYLPASIPTSVTLEDIQ